MDELIRLKGSDKVFLVKGTKHWLKTADTLLSLGFKFGDEVEVDSTEFAKYEEGEPIEVEDAEVIRPGGVIESEDEPVREIWQ